MAQQFAADYVDVAERIRQFRDQHPEGSLQPADQSVPYRIETIGDKTYIVVVAAAYRSPEDQRPGVGMAYEEFPGRTPYTRNSELQNAETSAWGRAIVAALAADTKKGIASADEVRNRSAERPDAVPASDETINELGLEIDALEQPVQAQLKEAWRSHQLPKIGDLSAPQVQQVRTLIRGLKPVTA
jgi:hypothetical protein